MSASWQALSDGPSIGPALRRLSAGVLALELLLYTVMVISYASVVMLERKSFHVAIR